MKPVYICVPYFMGEFNPARAALLATLGGW